MITSVPLADAAPRACLGLAMRPDQRSPAPRLVRSRVRAALAS
ncbi:hypothetical protein [Streptomyces sp. NPDC059491]